LPGKSSNKVGVFGANGFIGRHLVRRLCRDGVPTIAFGRDFPADYSEIVGHDVETRRMDLSDVLRTQIVTQEISTVVQLISSSGPALGNARIVSDISSNIAPHVSFIESCIMAKVESYVFLSSGGTIYGPPERLPISEDHPTNPISSYGMTKMIAEQYLRLLCRNSTMGYTSLRVSNPFGPGQDTTKGQGLVAFILKSLSEARPVTVYGDGKSQRDYLYIADLIDAICAAIDRPAVGGPVNIGSGVGRSILDVIAALEQVTGRDVPVVFADERATDTRSNILDPAKARKLLGWAPKTDFMDGLRMTVRAFGEAG
jgi:UDP-glucose 4-epimerase